MIAPWLFVAVALAGGVGAALRLVVDGVSVRLCRLAYRSPRR